MLILLNQHLKKRRIKMSEDKIGVALVKEACPVCAKTFDGPIVMNTKLTKPQADNVKEMHGKTVGFLGEPCDKCKGFMEKGIIIVTIDPDKTEDKRNPYRTGGFFVVREEFVERLIEDRNMLDDVMKRRVMMIDHKMAEHLGLFELAKQNEKDD